MKIKGKKRIIIFNSILFAILFLSISFNKEILRPIYNQTRFVGVLTGCFPNFIAALIIGLCFMNGIVTRKPKHERLIVYMSSIIIFVILAAEELMPMWGASTHYDLLDIVASGVGSLFTITIFELIVLRRKKNKLHS